MAIRHDTNEFPFGVRTKWIRFFIINWSKKELQEYHNVSDKKELVKELDSILKNNETDNYELYGIWPGEYSTDIFKIPIDVGFNELNKHYPLNK